MGFIFSSEQISGDFYSPDFFLRAFSGGSTDSFFFLSEKGLRLFFKHKGSSLNFTF